MGKAQSTDARLGKLAFLTGEGAPVPERDGFRLGHDEWSGVTCVKVFAFWL
jgi:hypothetical protein